MDLEREGSFRKEKSTVNITCSAERPQYYGINYHTIKSTSEKMGKEEKTKCCPRINRTLLPLKIVLFCWYGASSSLIPYMTVHMKELGITVSETAIIYTLLPVTQLVCTPLAGMIADKLGRYKDVLMLSVLSSVAFATAILFVPAAPESRLEHPEIHLLCGPFTLPHVEVEKCWGGPCNVFHEHRLNPLRLLGCRIDCPQFGGDQYANVDTLCGNDTMCAFDLAGKPVERSSNLSVWMSFGSPHSGRSTCRYPIEETAQLFSMNYDNDDFSVSNGCPISLHKGQNSCTLNCNFEQLPDDENGTFPHINQCVRTQGSWVLTFWLYFVLRILFNVFSSICLTLLDATSIAMVEAHGGQYGRQRFWAILAQAVISPVTGFLVDLLSQHRPYTDYSPAFHLYNVLAVCTAIAVWIMAVDVPPPAENVLANFRKLIKVPPVFVLMIVVFWLGAMWGFVESFLFWYLMDMGSPNFLLGLTLTTGAIVGLPFLHESDWFVRKVGQVNLLLVALLFYFIRFFGYSYIWNPWLCIPFEAMEAFTYHLMWVAAATYSADLAPQGLLATIQGCVGGIHYGVGKGSGSFAGGTMMDRFGARLAFRVMGVASGIMLILYGIVYYSWVRKYDKERLKARAASITPDVIELKNTNNVPQIAINNQNCVQNSSQHKAEEEEEHEANDNVVVANSANTNVDVVENNSLQQEHQEKKESEEPVC